MNKRILILYFTGLFTDPAKSDWCGARPLIEQYAQDVDAELKVYAYNRGGDSPDVLCRIVYEEIKSGGYERVVAAGHSFGGAFLKFFCDWLKKWHPGEVTICLAVFLDPAPNFPMFGQLFDWHFADMDDSSRWHIETSVVLHALCFYQHNQQALGVGICGVPFHEIPGVVEDQDVSSWRLDHVSICGDSRVWNNWKNAMNAAIAA